MKIISPQCDSPGVGGARGNRRLLRPFSRARILEPLRLGGPARVHLFRRRLPRELVQLAAPLEFEPPELVGHPIALRRLAVDRLPGAFYPRRTGASFLISAPWPMARPARRKRLARLVAVGLVPLALDVAAGGRLPRYVFPVHAAPEHERALLAPGLLPRGDALPRARDRFARPPLQRVQGVALVDAPRLAPLLEQLPQLEEGDGTIASASIRLLAALYAVG
jgi:hypothetical protein